MHSKLVKQAGKLLLSVVIVSIGLGSMPAKAQVSDAQVRALVEALRLAAPQTGTENDGLYSDWQIKPENIPRWSRQCNNGQELTPRQFEARPVTARRILVCVMRDVLQEQYSASSNNESVAVQRAASWWMTGKAENYSNPPNSYTRSYIEKVLSFYQQQQRQLGTETTTEPSTQATAPSPKPTASSPSASTAPISDAQVSALVEALRLAAPQTGTDNDELYSDWQVKPENIPRWSKQCQGEELTPRQFATNAETAQGIIACIMGDVLKLQYTASGSNESIAVQRAASWWMTGDPNQYNRGSTASYTQKVLSFYKQSRLQLLPHI
ncbi:MAG: hypothetical protein F6K09_14335 [Merismopedia sp. SIO2A8]|nr:hypothetical protein [Symploca sp. SIO2B6]NET49862.1 hypothetical protein [Merismopedia sp. SIO2A8]